MYPEEPRNNYLILTPDGVGSTYLQRALTVYLQCAGLDYWNTHELLNGLGKDDQGNLYNDFKFEYTQSIEEICNLLLVTGNLLVSRVANYHLFKRNIERNDASDNSIFYRECNRKFKNILFCSRDPFEYALSWSIRNETQKLNVYSINERIATHGINLGREIDLVFFQSKLDQYTQYEYWASENFNITKTVYYDDLHNNIDLALQDITGLTDSVKKKSGISLQDYSRFRYLSSLYSQTNNPSYINAECIKNLDSMFELHTMIDNLHKTYRLPTTIPIKMNTLSDKISNVKNFDQAVSVYNKWTNNSNRHTKVTNESLAIKVKQEDSIYAN